MIKTVLVTGGSGYIGTAVCINLVISGYRVVNIDRKYKKIKGVTQIHSDLRDTGTLEAVFKLSEPDAIIHLAAETEVSRSIKEPTKYYNENTVHTLTLAELAKKYGVKYFVYASSSSVYGNKTHMPLTEIMTPNPISPYGRSKLLGEMLLKDYPFRTRVLRLFNVCGAMSNIEHGYTRKEATHLIPAMCRHYINDTDLPVYSNTIDETPVRDYTDLNDVALAFVMSLDNFDYEYDIINIGGGNPRSISEVIEAFNLITRNQLKTTCKGERVGDVVATHADIRKAKGLLGWKPKQDFYNTLLTAIKWERKRNES